MNKLLSALVVVGAAVLAPISLAPTPANAEGLCAWTPEGRVCVVYGTEDDPPLLGAWVCDMVTGAPDLAACGQLDDAWYAVYYCDGSIGSKLCNPPAKLP